MNRKRNLKDIKKGKENTRRKGKKKMEKTEEDMLKGKRE
jgi:hypothetical protein